MKRGRLTKLTLAAAIAVLAFAPASAHAITETATSGNVTAQLSYDKAKFDTFKNVREAITRNGTPLVNKAAPSPPSCPLCGPDPAFGGRGNSVTIANLDAGTEPEVIFDFFTGGAHCCFYSHVFSFSGGAYTGVLHEWGDEGYTLADLDGDGKPEFKSFDPAFAYAFGSFASSQFPPQIWKFSGGQFLNVTKQFPALIQGDAKRLTRLLKKYKGTHLYRFTAKQILAAYTADACLLGSCKTGFALLAKKKGGIARAGKFKRQLRRFLTRLGYLA